MAKQKQIQKEDFLRVALHLLETEGKEGLNVRALARAAGCSTQPFYLCFASKEAFDAALLSAAKEEMHRYIDEEGEDVLFFKNGMGYLRFAKEKPRLFRYIFTENPYSPDENDAARQKETVAAICRLGGYREDVGLRFFGSAWTFMHGLASQIAAGYICMSEEDAHTLLHDAFAALRAYYGGMQ